MVWLLPDPDSPTMATVSRGLTARFTPRTASTIPSGVLKRMWRPVTLRRVDSSTSVVPRVERVAQPVTEEIEGEQRRDKEDRREDEHPWRRLDRGGALRDKRAEAGQRLLHAQSEEGEEALEQDYARHQDRDEDHHRANRVGNNVPADDRPRVQAHRFRGEHELALLQGQRLAAHDARHVQPFDGADRDEDEDEVAAEEDDQQDHQEDEGQGVEDF